jgi:hypothetical protein
MRIRIKQKEEKQEEMHVSLKQEGIDCVAIQVDDVNIGYINDLDNGTFHFYPHLIKRAGLKISKHKRDL